MFPTFSIAVPTSALALACFLAAPTEPTTPALASKENSAPPGMVFLPKERKVVIGFEDDAAKDLIISHDGGLMTIWGETPAHKVAVDDFFLMSTEVTNEQFAEYVKAAGSMPPTLWAKDAIEVARRAFLEESGKARAEARAAGKPLPEKVLFDADTWWRKNWEDADWDVPEEIAALPVVEVSHKQAEAYARWAGLRLMTEFEFQRAVRGKTENLYPWGSNWLPKNVVCAENANDRLAEVGSRPGGMTAEGIYDLPGSVWEWTSSKYLPYPNYQTSTVKISSKSNSRVENLIVEWDESLFVVVGGSYKNGAIAARASTRQGEYSDETTTAMGFRCAASPTVGLDIANLIERAEVPRSIRSNYKFDMSLTIAMDRWKYRKGKAGERLDNYAVITDYDYVLFTPVAELNSSNPAAMGKKTVTDGPLILGFLSTTLPLTSPPLEPGTYVVGWRAAGVNREKEKDPNEVDEEEEEGPTKRPLRDFEVPFDEKKENLVFFNQSGDPMLAHPFAGVESKKLKQGTMAVKFVAANEKKEIPSHEEIVIGAVVPAGSRGLLFDIKLVVPSGTTAGDWRKQ